MGTTTLIRLCEISCPLGARSVALNHSFPAPNYSHSNPHRPLFPYHTYRHTHTPPPLTSAYLSLTVNCAINRSWCPDRTMAQARKYIAESMGSNYAENVILDLEKTWEESDNRTPLINFLSMGSDPTSLIENLAKRHKFGTYNISLCKTVFYDEWNESTKMCLCCCFFFFFFSFFPAGCSQRFVSTNSALYIS